MAWEYKRKHLEIGLHRAASLQCSRPIMEREGALWPVKCVTSLSCPPEGLQAQHNHVNHDHITQARRRRSVLTLAQSESHSSYYPGEESSVTFPRITHAVDQRSASNLQEVMQQSPPPTPRRPEDLTVTRPMEPPGQIINTAFWTLSLPRRAPPNIGLCPGFITAAQLGSRSQFSTFSSVLCFIHYFNFTGSLPQPVLPVRWISAYDGAISKKKKVQEKQQLPFKLLIAGNGYVFDEHWALWRRRSEAELGMKIINSETRGRKVERSRVLSVTTACLTWNHEINKRGNCFFFMWRAASLTQ